jgi:hypothetical protein
MHHKNILDVSKGHETPIPLFLSAKHILLKKQLCNDNGVMRFFSLHHKYSYIPLYFSPDNLIGLFYAPTPASPINLINNSSRTINA